MRVATYTQPVAATRGSVAALSILILTIVLGTTVASTLATYFTPNLAGLLTYVWMGIYVLAFLGLMFGHGINWISWLIRYRILLVLLLIGAIVSVAWSVDAQVSAERVVHLFGTSLIGIYLGYTVPLLRMLRVFASVLAIIMVASLVAALMLPELGFSAYEGTLVWSGILNSKNDLGFWAATGVLLYVTLSDSTHSLFLRLLCYVLAGLCLALLAFSQSATSLLAMLVAGALSLYLFIAARFRLGFIQMSVIALLFASLIGVAAVNIDTAELVGRTEDLTGRAEVWRQTWKLIMDRPLTGYGYGSIWFPTEGTLWIQQSLTDFTWIVYHAHNGFLQVASEIGLPMAIIALLMVAQQLIEIFYCQYERQQAAVLFVLAFVVLFLIGNVSEARFLVTRELYWIFFIALPISMLRQINVVADTDIPLTSANVDVDLDLDGGFNGGFEGGFDHAAPVDAVARRAGVAGSPPDSPAGLGIGASPDGGRGIVPAHASDRLGSTGSTGSTDSTDSTGSIKEPGAAGRTAAGSAAGTVSEVLSGNRSGTDTQTGSMAVSLAGSMAGSIAGSGNRSGIDPPTDPATNPATDPVTGPDSTDGSATEPVGEMTPETGVGGAVGQSPSFARADIESLDLDSTDIDLGVPDEPIPSKRSADATYEDAIRDDWYELPADVTHDETMAARAAAEDRFDKAFDDTGDGTDGEWFDASIDHGDDTDR